MANLFIQATGESILTLLDDTSNIISERITDTSNVISERINNLTDDLASLEILELQDSDNLLNVSNIIGITNASFDMSLITDLGPDLFSATLEIGFITDDNPNKLPERNQYIIRFGDLEGSIPADFEALFELYNAVIDLTPIDEETLFVIINNQYPFPYEIIRFISEEPFPGFGRDKVNTYERFDSTKITDVVEKLKEIVAEHELRISVNEFNSSVNPVDVARIIGKIATKIASGASFIWTRIIAKIALKFDPLGSLFKYQLLQEYTDDVVDALIDVVNEDGIAQTTTNTGVSASLLAIQKEIAVLFAGLASVTGLSVFSALLASGNALADAIDFFSEDDSKILNILDADIWYGFGEKDNNATLTNLIENRGDLNGFVFNPSNQITIVAGEYFKTAYRYATGVVENNHIEVAKDNSALVKSTLNTWTSFAISFRIKFEADVQVILVRAFQIGQDYFTVKYSNGLILYEVQGSSSALSITAPYTPVIDAIKHIVIMFSGITGELSVYEDNILIESVDTAPYDPAFQLTGNVRLFVLQNCFSIVVEDMRIFSRILTADEIRKLYDVYDAPVTMGDLDTRVSGLDTRLTTAEQTASALATTVANLTTDNIAEGDNLYYTDARAEAVSDVRDDTIDDRITNLTTDDIAEGNNLYFTDARAEAVSDMRDDTIDDRITNLTTDDIAEGNNLYFTDARAEAVSDMRDDTIDDRITNLSTDDIAEGNNLYYTDDRAQAVVDARGDTIDDRITDLKTDDIEEGNTNLYYTTDRANTDFDTRLGIKTTDNLTEGNNLYFTDARAVAVSDIRDDIIDDRITDLWLKDGNTIKQENYEVKISQKTTLGSQASSSGVLIYIPFYDFVQDLTGNASITFNQLNPRLREDASRISDPDNLTLSPFGHYCYFGWDAGGKKRKLIYNIPSIDNNELYDTIAISWWNTITGYLIERFNNDPSTLFMTRRFRGLGLDPTSSLAKLSVGDDMGIKIRYNWTGTPSQDIVFLEISVRFFDPATGTYHPINYSIERVEFSEVFIHYYVVFNSTNIRVFANQSLVDTHTLSASFATYKICNVSEHIHGSRFDDNEVCRFDYSDFGFYTTEVATDFAQSVNPNTYTNIDTLVVFNQTKLNSLDCAFLSIGGVPLRIDAIGRFDSGITNDTVSFYRGNERPVIV